jgi:hypothetical protein
MSGTTSGIYSPTYTVEYYDKLCKSYTMRSGIIPFDDKEAFIDYLTSTVVLHGGLAGPLSTIAAYFSKQVRVASGDASIRNQVYNTLDKLDFMWVQMAAWLSVFMYNYTCVVYFPRQKIEMKCPECDHTFAINNAKYTYPFRIIATEYQQDGVRRMRSNLEIGSSEKRQHPRQYGIACQCPSCNSDISGVPEVTWQYSLPGKLTLINPKLYEVRVNDIGEKSVVIDPKYYKGALKLDTELDWFDLHGIPWNLAVTYASKDMVYTPAEDYYMLVSLREFAAIGTAGSPVAPMVSSISDVISMDIYKMGNEGLALSKINPLYLISPSNINNPAFDGVPMGDFRDFILKGVKAHQERDINRVIYSPLPVSADPLFGDGKRFMHAQEIVMQNNLILGGLSMSAQALDGASGFAGDPVKFDAWNTIMKLKQAKWTTLIDNIMRLTNEKYHRAVLSKGEDTPVLWMTQLRQIDGGMNLTQKWQLVTDGTLPLDEMLSDIGVPDVKLWRSYIKEARLSQEKHNIDVERAVTNLHNIELEKDSGQGGPNGAPNMHVARQAILQEADATAQELIQLPVNDRKSRLSQMEKEDYVTYCVIVKQLEALRTQMEREQNQQG